jgi:hypothetical protein
MKTNVPSFIGGMLTSAAVLLSSATVLYASTTVSIEIFPINIIVDGEAFEPKDPNGDRALVFTYNGTTYAPLRALAEAYGLEVGYDDAAKMATVSKPSETTAVLAPSPTPSPSAAD